MHSQLPIKRTAFYCTKGLVEYDRSIISELILQSCGNILEIFATNVTKQVISKFIITQLINISEISRILNLPFKQFNPHPSPYYYQQADSHIQI